MTSTKYMSVLCLAFFLGSACNEDPSMLVPGDFGLTGEGPRSVTSPDEPMPDRREVPESAADDGSGSEEAWIELRWTGTSPANAVNLDLHVREPDGTHLYYLSTVATNGGSGRFADHPECISFDCDGSERSPSERIAWDASRMQAGTYEVWVTNDGDRAEGYELEFNLPNNAAVESGSVAAGGTSSTYVADLSREEPGDCIGKLRARGVNFSTIRIREGSCEVDDAVMIEGPLNGITYRVNWARSTQRFRTSCDVALALYDSAALMREHSIDTVYHQGSYECRNVRGGSGLSQHGLGRAMDYAAFRTTAGTEVSVVRHWEHNTTTPRTAAGRTLRAIATGLNAYFDNVLDADERNHDDHFHAELSGR